MRSRTPFLSMAAVVAAALLVGVDGSAARAASPARDAPTATAVGVTAAAMAQAVDRAVACPGGTFTWAPTVWDFTGDGTPDGVIGYECTAGSPHISGVAVYVGGRTGISRRGDVPPTMTSDAISGIFVLGRQLVVQFHHYMPGDPLCCASAERVIRYRWGGRSWVPRASWTTPYALEEPDPGQAVDAVLVMGSRASYGQTLAFDMVARNTSTRRWTGRLGVESTALFLLGGDGAAGAPFRSVRDGGGRTWRSTRIAGYADSDSYQWTLPLALRPGQQVLLHVRAVVVSRSEGGRVRADAWIQPIAGTGGRAARLAARRGVRIT